MEQFIFNNSVVDLSSKEDVYGKSRIEIQVMDSVLSILNNRIDYLSKFRSQNISPKVTLLKKNVKLNMGDLRHKLLKTVTNWEPISTSEVEEDYDMEIVASVRTRGGRYSKTIVSTSYDTILTLDTDIEKVEITFYQGPDVKEYVELHCTRLTLSSNLPVKESVVNALRSSLANRPSIKYSYGKSLNKEGMEYFLAKHTNPEYLDDFIIGDLEECYNYHLTSYKHEKDEYSKLGIALRELTSSILSLIEEPILIKKQGPSEYIAVSYKINGNSISVEAKALNEEESDVSGREFTIPLSTLMANYDFGKEVIELKVRGDNELEEEVKLTVSLKLLLLEYKKLGVDNNRPYDFNIYAHGIEREMGHAIRSLKGGDIKEGDDICFSSPTFYADERLTISEVKDMFESKFLRGSCERTPLYKLTDENREKISKVRNIGDIMDVISYKGCNSYWSCLGYEVERDNHAGSPEGYRAYKVKYIFPYLTGVNCTAWGTKVRGVYMTKDNSLSKIHKEDNRLGSIFVGILGWYLD